MKKIGVTVLVVAVVGVAAWSYWPTPSLPPNARADLVVVTKGAHRLDLYQGDSVLKSYTVSLGRHPVGAKTQQGDGKTPEGEYVLDYRKTDSSFYRALHISYPGPAEFANVRARGVDPGGLIMVHGMKNGLGWLGRLHRAIDWTDGCVAVT